MAEHRALAAAFAATLSLLGASSASAASTVGQLPTPNQTCTNIARLQANIVTGASYEIPADGVITSWSFRSGAVPAVGLKLKVGRSGGGTAYTLIGEASGGVLAANATKTLAARIPVKRRDYIGVYAASGQCYASTASAFDLAGQYEGDPAMGTTSVEWPYQSYGRVPVQARVEADADNDNFGDETQDQCVGTAGIQDGCPPPDPDPDPAPDPDPDPAPDPDPDPAPDPDPDPAPDPDPDPDPAPNPGSDPDSGGHSSGSDTIAPVIGGVRKRGTQLAFTLSEAASVTVRLVREATGRRAGRRCARPSRRTRGARRCRRLERVGYFVQEASAGVNTSRIRRGFAGRRLPAGRYRATITAVDAAGNVSKVAVVRFRITRR